MTSRPCNNPKRKLRWLRCNTVSAAQPRSHTPLPALSPSLAQRQGRGPWPPTRSPRDPHTQDTIMQTQNNTTTRPEQNLVGTLQNNTSFGIFSNAIEKAGLRETLAGDTQHTVFAPTDEAFGKLPSGTMDRLMKPENKDELAALVNYHLVNGHRTSADVGRWDAARTVNGQSAPIKSGSDKLT
ncbi:MAG: hypothetical protein E6Q76_15640, partial [Rhizobium sp.]